MAKLYYRYGAMGSSKSANILMVRYNYEEREQYTQCEKMFPKGETQIWKLEKN